ncbi:UNVERIFIED_CONTAM: hypothetical protein GTU68_021787 [Idotea baltica]|nr:hypothetical protein [Idotea baltica]
MIDRKLTNNNYHQYIKPDRESEEGALKVHGITTEFLADKPRFADIAEDFIEYIKGAELIIHNAPFDVGYLDHELAMAKASVRNVSEISEINDSLVLARQMHPGQRNSLDALCKRYDISNLHRELHGALLDSEILADVYLAMTGGQKNLLLGEESNDDSDASNISFNRLAKGSASLKVLTASTSETEAHQKYMEELETPLDKSLWN